MHIGMLADVYMPHVSGVTNYISLNKEYLEKAGHQVREGKHCDLVEKLAT
jgi:hypothetical protein